MASLACPNVQLIPVNDSLIKAGAVYSSTLAATIPNKRYVLCIAAMEVEGIVKRPIRL